MNYYKDQLKNILEVHGEKAAQAAKDALAQNAEELCSLAKAKCPVDTGRLRDSIHVLKRDNGAMYIIVADAQSEDGTFYARIVEFSPKINEPYMYPAFDEMKDQMKQNVKNAIKGAINGR